MLGFILLKKMKFEKKLKKTRRRAVISYLVAILVIVYFLMILIKGIYFVGADSDYIFIYKIKDLCLYVIDGTYFWPFDWLWEKIAYIDLEQRDPILFYNVMVPPLTVFMICSFFISDYRTLKRKYYELRREIEKEVALRNMRKDAGIESISETATVDVVVSNATNNDPAWHNTWWGKICIGLVIVLITTAIGLK